MNKSGGIILAVFFGIILFGNLVLAVNSTDMANVQNAYSCLNSQIDQKTCNAMSPTEKIFSLLATGKCLSEVMALSQNDGECWPSGKCDVKLTAQAILALDQNGKDSSKAQEWLLSHSMTPRDLIWYLEVEHYDGPTSCTVTYGRQAYNFNINEDKTLSGSAGSCLTLGPGGYWFQISPSCYDDVFEVTCEDDFLTTLLFKKSDSPTVHVLDVTHSASAYGSTSEQIQASCFTSNGLSCDYVANAWAASVLSLMGQDVSNFIPYLITMQEKEYFPSPFLYITTGLQDYADEILSLQINKQYWRVSVNQYFDTALAMWPFQGLEFTEKSNAIDWLWSVQQEDGCWNGDNIRDNAFILYSFWPRSYGGGIDHDDDNVKPDNGCSESGYYCMLPIDCDGSLLSDYSCPGAQSCCDTPLAQESCQEMGGQVCSSNQFCTGQESYDPSLSYGETCCTDGYCKQVEESPPYTGSSTNTCEDNFGICTFDTCDKGYKISTEYSCDDGDVCCMPKEKSGGAWWIWVLFVLIILVVLGILYRDKLRIMMLKMTHKGGPGPSSPTRPRHRPTMPPRYPPSYHREPQRVPSPRPIVPKTVRKPVIPKNPAQKPKSQKELDDVLKKLKEMGR